MADDTVERIREAKQAVIGAVLRYTDACERDLQPSQKAKALLAVDDAFDALIAAVRAEELTSLDALIQSKLTPALNTGTAMDMLILVGEALRERRAEKLQEPVSSDYGRLL